MTTHRADEAISVSAVGLVLRRAEAIGAELDPLLTKSDSSALSAGKSMSAASKAKASTIYKSCMISLRDHVAAASERSHLSFDCADILCECVIRCQRLEEVLVRTVKFTQTLNGRCTGLAFEISGKQAILKVTSKAGGHSVDDLLCDFFEMCFYYKLFSWLIGEPLVGGGMRLAYPRLLDERTLADILGASVSFDAEGTSLVFSKEMLKRPLVRTAQELGEVLKLAPIELLALSPIKQLSLILRGIFRRALEERVQIPQVDEVAYQLGQSGPTLRRHLAKESTSFQALADECRMEKARELLGNPGLTIDEISDHLGFSAPSGFSRAFKDWTGQAPSVYRQQRQYELSSDGRFAVGYS